jgi:hypothetical protein
MVQTTVVPSTAATPRKNATMSATSTKSSLGLVVSTRKGNPNDRKKSCDP